MSHCAGLIYYGLLRHHRSVSYPLPILNQKMVNAPGHVASRNINRRAAERLFSYNPAVVVLLADLVSEIIPLIVVVKSQ